MSSRTPSTSGKALVAGLVVLVLLAGLLLVWATRRVEGRLPPSSMRLPLAITAKDLPHPTSEGAKLLQRHCVACHALPDPLQHRAAAWPAVLTDMEARIGTRIMKAAPMPSRAEWKTLEAYLQAHAVDAASAVGANEP